ncbi:MAG: RIP metalloprotease RseP [Deltaproteobacteria bacterium]|nr:RIP metalloprotease RseP [Deltaproteobacteria bacterium]
MSLFNYLYAVIPMLGILIFVHELGHFVAAKLCGVRVLKFSLGFGSPIGIGNLRLRWVRGGTEYVVAWFPLGGYVKMLGEQMAGVQGEEEEAVEDAAPDEYLNAKPTWQKLFITFAGPAMNLLLPVVAFVIVLGVGLPQRSPVVGMVEAGSPALSVGLESGDTLLALDGVALETWDDFERTVRASGGEALELRYAREGVDASVELPVTSRKGLDEFGSAADVGWVGLGHRRLPALLGVPEADAIAAAVGLRSGDRVMRVGADGEEVEDWESLRRLYAAAGPDDVLFGIERRRGEETENLDLRVPALGDLAALGVIPATILVHDVNPELPAAAAGLESGDLILAVEGKPVGSFASFAETVRASGGSPLAITYARDGATHTVEIEPKETTVPGPYEIEGMDQKVYLIGITQLLATLPGSLYVEKILNPLVSIPKAAKMTVDETARFLRGLSRFASGELGTDQLAGPIGIAEIARKSLDLGWQHYLGTMILISINLGILNLLPIPILDGGQALIFAVEGIKRSPISRRSRELVQQMGLTLIIMLMGLAFGNDLSRHWSSFVEWLRSTGL